ncbi:putative sensor histidine kinase pdtaS [compost metagenome]
MTKLERDFIDFHEKIKYKLVKHLCIFFVILMSVVTIVNYSNEHFSAMPNVFAVGMCLIALVFLKYTKNYRLVAKICAVVSFFIISGAFLFLKATHYLTPMWMIVNIIFVFFILGKKWGISMLICHFLLLFYYLVFYHEANIVAVDAFSGNDIATFITEYSIVGFAIGYLLNLYILTTKYSEKELQENNNILIEQNKIISKQNSEMEVMLREIHHRVKNNLQIITSLLRLQANSAGIEGGGFYQEAIDRVTAMAIIHEKMYQSGSLSKFDLEKYLKSLVNSLLASYSIEQKPTFEIEVEVEDMKSKSIVPLALLINELLLNSLKHAFQNQENPKIVIRLVDIQEVPFTRFQLYYSDNGTWVENAVASFGTEIIQAMSEQLEGDLELKTSNSGTEYVFNLANLS